MKIEKVGTKRIIAGLIMLLALVFSVSCTKNNGKGGATTTTYSIMSKAQAQTTMPTTTLMTIATATSRSSRKTTIQTLPSRRMTTTPETSSETSTPTTTTKVTTPTHSIKPTTKTTIKKPTPKSTTTTKSVHKPATKPTSPQKRALTRTNLIAIINEERARAGNAVKVYYGDMILQKISDVRAKEQIRLFGATRPIPCSGCDYCHGSKQCITNETQWIKETYGVKYAHGSYAGKGATATVDDFMARIRQNSAVYNLMIKGSWNRFTFSTSEGNGTTYLYLSYGKW